MKENLFAKRRNDLEPQDIECVWIEISLNRKKMLIGTFYRPPTSPASTLTSIETSIGLACDTNISDILIVGDFNLDVLKRASGNKIKSICYQFNLYNLIEEPTHFFADSSSCIDLILTSNKNSILLSGVGDPFLEQNIKYHCPFFVFSNFVKMFQKPLQDISGFTIKATLMAYVMHCHKQTGRQLNTPISILMQNNFLSKKVHT